MEKWIKGYENLYSITDDGIVFSYHSNKKIRLSTHIDYKGYEVVQLHNGNHKSIRVHRLVAIQFIPNPNNLPQVNHIDENKSNNVVSNLEWCDNKYNANFGTRKEKLKISHQIPVIKMDLNGSDLKFYESVLLAKQHTGLDNSGISACCKGRYKTYGGYRWKYANSL